MVHFDTKSGVDIWAHVNQGVHATKVRIWIDLIIQKAADMIPKKWLSDIEGQLVKRPWIMSCYLPDQQTRIKNLVITHHDAVLAVHHPEQ